MIEHHTATIGSVQLHYVTTEASGPPLLLLHAALDSWESYHALLPELAAMTQVYALDLRGHGQSSHTPGSYQLHTHVQDLHEFVQVVIRQSVILIGHSLGGFVASWYAAQHPSWVRALIDEDTGLLETVGTPMPQFASLRDTLQHYKATGKTLAEFEQACAQDVYRDQMTRLELFGWETVRRHARQRWQMDPTALDPLIDGTMAPPHYDL